MIEFIYDNIKYFKPFELEKSPNYKIVALNQFKQGKNVVAVFYITPEYLRLFDRRVYTGDCYISFDYKNTHYFELISKIPKKILIKMYSSINNRNLFYD